MRLAYDFHFMQTFHTVASTLVPYHSSPFHSFIRVMPDAVLLVDDVVLIINGAQKGFEGLKPTYATCTTRVPHLYNTSAPLGSR